MHSPSVCGKQNSVNTAEGELQHLPQFHAEFCKHCTHLVVHLPHGSQHAVLPWWICLRNPYGSMRRFLRRRAFFLCLHDSLHTQAEVMGGTGQVGRRLDQHMVYWASGRPQGLHDTILLLGRGEQISAETNTSRKQKLFTNLSCGFCFCLVLSFQALTLPSSSQICSARCGQMGDMMRVWASMNLKTRSLCIPDISTSLYLSLAACKRIHEKSISGNKWHRAATGQWGRKPHNGNMQNG